MRLISRFLDRIWPTDEQMVWERHMMVVDHNVPTCHPKPGSRLYQQTASKRG